MYIGLCKLYCDALGRQRFVLPRETLPGDATQWREVCVFYLYFFDGPRMIASATPLEDASAVTMPEPDLSMEKVCIGKLSLDLYVTSTGMTAALRNVDTPVDPAVCTQMCVFYLYMFSGYVLHISATDLDVPVASKRRRAAAADGPVPKRRAVPATPEPAAPVLDDDAAKKEAARLERNAKVRARRAEKKAAADAAAAAATEPAVPAAPAEQPVKPTKPVAERRTTATKAPRKNLAEVAALVDTPLPTGDEPLMQWMRDMRKPGQDAEYLIGEIVERAEGDEDETLTHDLVVKIDAAFIDGAVRRMIIVTTHDDGTFTAVFTSEFRDAANAN